MINIACYLIKYYCSIGEDFEVDLYGSILINLYDFIC